MRCSAVQSRMWHCCMSFEDIIDTDGTAEWALEIEGRNVSHCSKRVIVRFESMSAHRCEESGSREGEDGISMCSTVDSSCRRPWKVWRKPR